MVGFGITPASCIGPCNQDKDLQLPFGARSFQASKVGFGALLWFPGCFKLPKIAQLHDFCFALQDDRKLN
jgi:hypothetical protein